MVKFTSHPIEDNVNVSKVSPIKEFFVLLTSLLGILIVIYFLLGFALDLMIDFMPSRVEAVLTEWMNFKDYESSSEREGQVQRLLDNLVVFLPSQDLDYKVHIVDSEDVNALALPGGHIIIYSQLLADVESENELSMILAHELGHYANRDHLRAMGRGVVFLFVSAVFFGTNSSVTNFIGETLKVVVLNFSRQQERMADEFALDLVNKRYGHVGGATDFFKKIKKTEKLPNFLGFFSTHPLSDERIETLDSLIVDLNYPVKARIPLKASFKELLEFEMESINSNEEND